MSWNKIAAGLFASRPTEVEGSARVVIGLQEIVKLMREPVGEPLIVFTNVAGGSAVSTIVRRAKAIVSTIGGVNSHVVVVARDYNLPCIVGASDLNLALLANGAKVRLRSDGAIEVWSDAASELTPVNMQLLRCIVFAGALQQTADIVGFTGNIAEGLTTLENSGLIETAGPLAPTEAGVRLLDSWYAGVRDTLDAEQREALHLEFRPLDRALKQAASSWQQADSADDWDGRLKTVESLEALHRATLAYFDNYAPVLPHLQEFRDRLTQALNKVRDGETEYFVGVRVDSYHTVWFSLHEDLLRLLDKQRDSE